MAQSRWRKAWDHGEFLKIIMPSLKWFLLVAGFAYGESRAQGNRQDTRAEGGETEMPEAGVGAGASSRKERHGRR